MPAHTILVLGNPAAPHLALLDRLPASARVVAGETEEVLLGRGAGGGSRLARG